MPPFFAQLRRTYTEIPVGIRVISIATGIRWIGWGMCETLIPVFLYTYVHSYGASGVLDAFGRVLFFIVFPVAGALADRIHVKTFLLVGLLFFLGDSVGYILTGLTGLVVFAALANLFDGVAVVSDVIGRATYIRRYGTRADSSFLFGFSEAWINAGWLVGMLLAFFLVDRLGMLWMFAAIGPTTLITFLLYWRLLPDDAHGKNAETTAPAALSVAAYTEVWRQFRAWTPEVRLSAMLMLLVHTVQAVGAFLIPIYAYTEGASLRQVILIGIVFNLPVLFAAALGRLADRLRTVAAVLGLCGIAATLAGLALVTSFGLMLLLVLALKICITLAALAIEGKVTRDVHEGSYGRVSAIFEAIKDLGALIGPVALGVAIDAAGVSVTFVGVALILMTLAWMLQRLPADIQARG
jgi:MFS family permease